MNRRQYATTLVLSISLLTVALIPLSGEQGSSYNPWLDYDDSGTIDVEDLYALGQAYGTSGTPLNMPMALAYDSEWIDISDKRGQYFSFTPSFNLETSTWYPCVYGRATGTSPLHRKYWYGYEMPGWNKTYGGSSGDEGRSMVLTSDGGYAIAGCTYVSGSNMQVCLVKTDLFGAVQWSKDYGGIDDDYGYSVVQTSDGGYVIAGVTYYPVSTCQVYLVKTYADGTMAWNKTYGVEYFSSYLWSEGYSVVETSDGGYAIAGYTVSLDSSHQVYLVKTFADGTMAWNKTYGGTSLEHGYSVVQAGDGGFVIAGKTNSYGPGQFSVWLVKTDEFGAKQWDRTYGGELDDVGYSVIKTSDGGYAIAGYTDVYYGPSIIQVYLVKTDKDGFVTWQQTYGGAGFEDYGRSVIETSDGGYAIAGYTASFGSGEQMYLVKTDASGTTMWQQTHGGANDDYGYSVVETSDGGYAIAGNTNSYGVGTPTDNNVYLVKTDALGLMDLEWGVTITNITADALTFYRGKIDPYYNYIRVCIWVVKESP